jgi:hypothetical protein
MAPSIIMCRQDIDILFFVTLCFRRRGSYVQNMVFRVLTGSTI